MQEFGDIRKLRAAINQMKIFRNICAADLKVEARKKKELEKVI